MRTRPCMASVKRGSAARARSYSAMARCCSPRANSSRPARKCCSAALPFFPTKLLKTAILASSRKEKGRPSGRPAYLPKVLCRPLANVAAYPAFAVLIQVGYAMALAPVAFDLRQQLVFGTAANLPVAILVAHVGAFEGLLIALALICHSFPPIWND